MHGCRALLAECNDESAVVRFIQQLKDSPPFLEALKANATTAAAQWPTSTAQFRDAMERAAANTALDRDSLSRYSRRIWTLMEGHRRLAAEQARIEAIYRSSS